MNPLRRIWQKTAPDFLLSLVRFLLEPAGYKERRKAVLDYYRNLDPADLPAEIREGLRYLRWHKYTPFPFKWTAKYENLIPEVFRDPSNNCYYVVYDGRKMYFPASFTRSKVIWAVRAARREQDQQSPHLYLTNDFKAEAGSVIIDAGVAEGNFALSVVETAKKIYLVECDHQWMEALRLTFEPWKEKVIFVEKFMSDTSGPITVTIDELLSPFEDSHYFIKLDIEGYERKALGSMKGLMDSGKRVRMNVCTYHHPEDFDEIKTVLGSFGFTCTPTEGYVLFSHPGEDPVFRKVLLRAEKL